MDPAFAAIGARLSGVLDETQKVTLAGFRLLDPHGVVIAGRGDVGMSLAGIAEVSASGGYEKQMVVQPKPDAMLAASVTFRELAEVVAENVENAGGGAVQIGGEQIVIRAESRVENLEQIAKLPVKFRGLA